MSRYFDDNILHSGMIDEDDILHYGVKGMKWRKRLKSKLSRASLDANRKIKQNDKFNKMDQRHRNSELFRASSVERGDGRIGINTYENLLLTNSQKNQYAKGSRQEAERLKKKINERNKKNKRLRIKEKITRKLANML